MLRQIDSKVKRELNRNRKDNVNSNSNSYSLIGINPSNVNKICEESLIESENHLLLAVDNLLNRELKPNENDKVIEDVDSYFLNRELNVLNK